MSDAFKPVLYIKQGCPFCLKVRLFALEAGILDQIEQHEFSPGSAEERVLREELGAVLEKVSFPAARFGADRYVAESDDIITELVTISGHDPEALEVYRTYAREVLPSRISFYRENQALKSAA